MAQFLMVLGTAMSVGGTLAQGKAAQQNANYQADQLRQAAKDEAVSSQMQAAEVMRQTKLMQSRARAVGASSGAGEYGGVIDEIGAEGEYRSLFALFNGERAATDRLNQANVSEWEGAQARRASRIGAASTLLQSGTTMAQKYGGGGDSGYNFENTSSSTTTREYQ